MKPGLRALSGLTYVVVLAGAVVFVSRAIRARPLPTTYLIIWIVVSVILMGITAWAWVRSRKG